MHPKASCYSNRQRSKRRAGYIEYGAACSGMCMKWCYGDYYLQSGKFDWEDEKSRHYFALFLLLTRFSYSFQLFITLNKISKLEQISALQIF